MRALHWNADHGHILLVDVPTPTVTQPDQVLIKVAYSGVCGTDLHVMQGEFPASDDVIMGHEFTGVVEGIGEGVKQFKVGDKVAVDPNSSCMNCSFCLKGKPHYCPTGGGRSGIGMFRNGGWAEYCIAPQAQVFPLPDGMTLSLGALCEPMSCLLRGWEVIQPLNEDAKILITGCGMIGLLWASLLHHKGYRNITISEPTDSRRNLASKLDLGLSVITPNELSQQYEGKNTAIEGFDLIMDCSGSPKAIEAVFPLLRRGATFCNFGCCPNGSKVTICPADIMQKELRIVGSLINPFTFIKAVPLVFAMGEKYLDYSRVGIKVYSLNQFQEAFDDLKKGIISKAMFKLD